MQLVSPLPYFSLPCFLTCPLVQANDQKKAKHYQSALEYIQIADDKAAIIELKNAIQVDAKFADARYQLGLLYLKTENQKAAFGQLQRAVGLDSGNLDAGVKVAEFYLIANNKADSRKYVEQVLSINPDYLNGLILTFLCQLPTRCRRRINPAKVWSTANRKTVVCDNQPVFRFT